MSYLLLESGSHLSLESLSGFLLLESGGILPLWIPYVFATTLIPAALDTSDAFGIDPGQTAILSSAEDLDAFDIDPGQTTLIITGLDTGP